MAASSGSLSPYFSFAEASSFRNRSRLAFWAFALSPPGGVMSATGCAPCRNTEPWYDAGRNPLPKQSAPPGGIMPLPRTTNPGNSRLSLPRP